MKRRAGFIVELRDDLNNYSKEKIMANKGAQWERDFSKKLSLWWSEGEDDDCFWRTSQSGGRATQRAKKGKKTANSYGDIGAMTIDAESFTRYFCLELKRGYTKETDILDILDGKKKMPKVFEFWHQCEVDRIKGERKQSLVIFKRDRKQAVIMFRYSFYLKLKDNYGLPNKSFFIKSRHNDSYGVPALIYMLLDNWLEWVNPKYLKMDFLTD